ncbi:hypothetical protein AK812_SmicGene48445 [Symbiodinium microadriaticum]|uniref:Uncharacterized protein n=1 Tax=Symbiodinium microadriaticum TaxID=2951 RepID=A0A1Q9BJG0_SYMMI|nr:hypothetical protein AK812_SmicGene48445 [Symbiodinium microadriaticum]
MTLPMYRFPVLAFPCGIARCIVIRRQRALCIRYQLLDIVSLVPAVLEDRTDSVMRVVYFVDMDKNVVFVEAGEYAIREVSQGSELKENMLDNPAADQAFEHQ